MHTLTLIFNPEHTAVLMCEHHKLGHLNYIGGKIKELEEPISASYRELLEATGITKDDVDLQFIRHESTTSVTSNDVGVWSMFVTAGILKKDITLTSEKNPLVWVNLCDWNKLVKAQGNGSCLTYMLEARNVLGF